MATPGAPHIWSRRLMRLLLVLSAWPASTTLADSQADYFVHHLPGAPESPLVKMHAGHIEVTPEHNGNLFFWHFQNHHIAQKQRTVIWLNGGPGCSSEDGALMEIGPYRLTNDRTLVLNNGSWNEFANLLFVDNPVGTGFSFVDTNSYVKELDEMAAQFVAFLEKWYALFPEYEHDDLYLAGESYAGQHIPYIAQKVLERNRKPETRHRWNLAGLLIGNGWISPADQYDAYLKFAYERNLLDRTSEASDQLQQLWRVCRTRIAAGDFHVDLQECEAVLQEFLKLTRKPGPGGGGGAGGAPGSSDTCINMYDVRLTDSYPSCGMNWPPDLRYVTPYLRRPDVTEALHIRPAAKAWSECNGAVGSAFRARNSRPSVEILPSVLAEVPVLLFSGAEDLICNHVGTEQLIANLAWGGGRGFELAPGNLAPRRDWTVEGEPAGFWQEARNLTYVLFYNSSHMVPFDYPRRSRDMLDRFMGVDISSIGGVPTDSRLDGEKAGPSTSVGSDQTEMEEAAEEQRKLEEAKRTAYFKSGEVVLVIVAIAAAGWGYFVCRARRRREVQGYRGLSTGPAADDVSRRRIGPRGRDLEAADFDEGELDELHVRAPVEDGVGGGVDARYSAGGDTEDEEEEEGGLSGKVPPPVATATAADEKKKGQRRNGDSAESRPLTL